MAEIPIELVMEWDPEGLLAILNAQGLTAGDLKVQKKLLRVVNAWLDTGRRPDGSESTGDRNYATAEEKGFGVDPDDPADFGIVEAVRQFCRTYSLKVRDANLQHPGLWAVPMKDPRVGTYKQKVASSVVALLSSSWRDRIARCRKCGLYFYLAERHRKVLRNGLFCSVGCNRSASAVKRTRTRRQGFNPEVIQRAAWLLRKQKLKIRQDRQASKDQLLAALNQSLNDHPNEEIFGWRPPLKHGNYISGKWITLHWEEIEAAAKEAE